MSDIDNSSKNQSIVNGESEEKLLTQPKPRMGADESKRRLLKGTVAMAPVVLAVTSKPAMAAWCTVSGFLSGNLSQPHGQENCGGRSPGYYINHVVDNKTFKSVFNANWHGKTYQWMGEPTLYDVLKMNGDEDQYQFAAHAVAFYQNAKYIVGYGVSEEQAIKMIEEVLFYGVYTHPGTGTQMDAQDVVDFITNTFDDVY